MKRAEVLNLLFSFGFLLYIQYIDLLLKSQTIVKWKCFLKSDYPRCKVSDYYIV